MYNDKVAYREQPAYASDTVAESVKRDPRDSFVESVVNDLMANYNVVDAADIVLTIRKAFIERMHEQVAQLERDREATNEQITSRHEVIKRTISQL